MSLSGQVSSSVVIVVLCQVSETIVYTPKENDCSAFVKIAVQNTLFLKLKNARNVMLIEVALLKMFFCTITFLTKKHYDEDFTLSCCAHQAGKPTIMDIKDSFEKCRFGVRYLLFTGIYLHIIIDVRSSVVGYYRHRVIHC